MASPGYETPHTGKRRRVPSPLSPREGLAEAMKDSPVGKAFAKAATAVKAAVKAGSSSAIGLDDLFALTEGQLQTILDAGRQSKAAPSTGKDRSDFVITRGGCWISRRTADSKGGMKGAAYVRGDPIAYAEFNSNIIPHLRSRRYRLYQVAAVLNTKRMYPNATVEMFKAWARKYKLEASHICKLYKPLTYDRVMGDPLEVVMFEENKACFCSEHMILEPDYINRSRIKCDGQESCRHEPKCRVVG